MARIPPWLARVSRKTSRAVRRSVVLVVSLLLLTAAAGAAIAPSVVAATGSTAAGEPSEGILQVNESDDSGAVPAGEDESLLEIHSTADDEFSYRFVVDGTVEKTQVGPGGIAADDDDTVTPNDDGTVTVTGTTGDGAGDAFVVDGEIIDASVSGSDAVRVLQTRDVTDRFTKTTANENRTFEVRSTGDEGEFTYRILVDGDVERTQLGDGGSAAEDDDEITANDNGTTTVVGSTGDGAGDAFVVRGEVVHFRKVSGSDDYRLFLDGDPYPEHTLEIVPDGEDAAYRVEVTGTLAPADVGDRSPNPADAIDANVVTGSVYAGYAGDSYRFSGDYDLTFTEGDAQVLVDGTEVTDGSPDATLERINCSAVRASGEFDELRSSVYMNVNDGLDTMVYAATQENVLDGGESGVVDSDDVATGAVNGTVLLSARLVDEDGEEVARAENPREQNCSHRARPRLDFDVANVTRTSPGTYDVTFEYTNHHDETLYFWDSGLFVGPGDTQEENVSTDTGLPDSFEPGTHGFTVQWTPQSDDERLAWIIPTGSWYGYDEPITVRTGPASAYGGATTAESGE